MAITIIEWLGFMHLWRADQMATPASTVIVWPVIDVFFAAEIYASAQSSRNVCNRQQRVGTIWKAHLMLESRTLLDVVDFLLAVSQTLVLSA